MLGDKLVGVVVAPRGQFYIMYPLFGLSEPKVIVLKVQQEFGKVIKLR